MNPHCIEPSQLIKKIWMKLSILIRNWLRNGPMQTTGIIRSLRLMILQRTLPLFKILIQTNWYKKKCLLWHFKVSKLTALVSLILEWMIKIRVKMMINKKIRSLMAPLYDTIRMARVRIMAPWNTLKSIRTMIKKIIVSPTARDLIHRSARTNTAQTLSASTINCIPSTIWKMKS